MINKATSDRPDKPMIRLLLPQACVLPLDKWLYFIPYHIYTSKPIIIHTIRRIQVSRGRKTIMNKQVAMPSTGIKGTHGVLNALGASGSFFLKTITPIQTRMNANKVPILVISPTTLAGTKAAKRLTKSMNRKLLFEGVLNLGCTSENTLGNKPSRLIL